MNWTDLIVRAIAWLTGASIPPERYDPPHYHRQIDDDIIQRVPDHVRRAACQVRLDMPSPRW